MHSVSCKYYYVVSVTFVMLCVGNNNKLVPGIVDLPVLNSVVYILTVRNPENELFLNN